jgi:prepilin-type N-terminal cleavage/methylation domain-containing protein
MNKNKGFTLIEILTVVVILGVLAIIIIPIIDRLMKESDETAYKTQVDAIKTAAESWSEHNSDHLPNTSGGTTTVELRTLKQDGFISMKIINPLTDTYFYDNTYVLITRYYENYIYEVHVAEAPDENDQVYSETYEQVPTISLHNVTQSTTIAVGSTYNVLSSDVTATPKGTKTITSIEIEIKKNGLTVSGITTTAAATYIVTYRAIDSDQLSSTIQRIIIVR